MDQRLRRQPHLRHRARRALGQIGPQGLDGIDDDKRRRRAGFQRRQHVLHPRLGGQRYRCIPEAEPPGAQPHLIDGLLAGDIDNAVAGPGQRRGGLEQERRLADTGIATDQQR